MCGIAGIVSFKNAVDNIRLKKMTDIIVHRGPDGEGHWINAEGKVGLGHRRLSIIDLSDNAKQPMHYAEGRYTITFNGEIYNYIEIKNELVTKGYRFRSESDTEVLMALYDLKKQRCLDDLDGMFAFAIWDEKEQTLFCARDRFGEKPFYYYKNENEFVFGSELKQFFATGISKTLNEQVAYHYINSGIEGNPYKPEETFYKDIFQLMPASYLTLIKGSIQIKKYWDLDTKQISRLSFTDSVEKFTELFNTSLKRRMRSDVPVGSCLSGGLDSSSIVLSIDKIKAEGQIQKTFSARFKDFEKDEGKYMAMVVNKSRNIQNFDVWLTESDFLSDFNAISKHQDEPYGGTSVVAQYNVMKLAKKNEITVLIDGQGADEYLAGYVPFFVTYLNQLYGPSPQKYSIEKEKMREYHGLQHQLSFNGKMQLKYPGLFSTLSKTKRVFSSSSQKETGVNYMHAEITQQVKINSPKGKDNNNLRKSVYETINGIAFNNLLRYADRNAMAHSVEVRLPFLSHELVEFANGLPDEYKIHEGWSKYILRKSMEPILPNEIAWRKDKIGFAAPQEKWMQNNTIKGYVSDAKDHLVKNSIISKEQKDNCDKWRSLMLYKMLQ